MRGEKKRYCYIQKLITNKKYLIQEEKNMNIKEIESLTYDEVKNIALDHMSINGH